MMLLQGLPLELDTYVDVEGGLGRIMGNQKVYKTLLSTFSKTDYRDQLHKEVEAGNMDAAAAAAHAVKGMCGNLSMHALYESAIQLEKACKSGELTPELMEQFSQCWEKTVEYCGLVLEKMEEGPLEI